MITECPHCEFYVEEETEFCPDCGMLSPGEPLFYGDESSFVRMQILLIGSVAALTAFAFVSIRIHENLLTCILLGLFIGGITAFFPTLIYAKRRAETELRTRFARDIPETLSKKEEKLRDALLELGIREDSMNKMLENENSSETLLQMEDIARIQTEVCHFQGAKIHIARLENELLPFASDLQNLSDQRLESGFSEIEEILAELDFIRENARQVKGEFYAERIAPEIEDILRSVEKSETYCRNLREKLSNFQKTKAFQESTYFVQNLSSINAFNQNKLGTIAIYSSEPILPLLFEELENEYWILSDEFESLQNSARKNAV